MSNIQIEKESSLTQTSKMVDSSGDDCEHCGQKQGFASNEPGEPAGAERICLNSACYEKRMADLAKTDIDKALEVCDTWQKSNRFRWAQEENRRGGPRDGSPRLHGRHSRGTTHADEDWNPREMMGSGRRRASRGGHGFGIDFYPYEEEWDEDEEEGDEIVGWEFRREPSLASKAFRKLRWSTEGQWLVNSQELSCLSQGWEVTYAGHLSG